MMARFARSGRHRLRGGDLVPSPSSQAAWRPRSRGRVSPRLAAGVGTTGPHRTGPWKPDGRLALALALLFASSLVAGEPAIRPGQLEADWLGQLELRYPRAVERAGEVTPADDAAGGVDGVTDGKWGFHTQREPQPWWQVDLGESMPLDRLVLFNRGDGFAGRAARVRILLSLDGQAFEQAYEHDGSDFHGHADQQPLVVPLAGPTARYVRLQLPGTEYFHLDEVQVFARGRAENVALRDPATQSSTSLWSVRHRAARNVARAATEAIEQGLRLADDLAGKGVDTADPRRGLATLAAELSDANARETYLNAQAIVRRLALRNPLLDFDAVVFAKGAPGMFPHVSDQHYGWWSRPGGGICVLAGLRSDQPTVTCLTQGWPAGNFARPELSYDGRRILFAWCRHYPHVADVADKTAKQELPEDAFYHVFEMHVDGSDVRQLTHGRYDDFDARYLPGGRIVFLSTRKGTSLQVGKRSAEATVADLCPDSYVRCGGGRHRPVSVFTLHTMDADGGDLCAISAFENFEWTPAVAWDGRVLYARWDYIDRFNGHFFSLWSTNPDGTGSQLVFGNYTQKPQCIFEARPIPGSTKLIFTATAHHSITGGSLALLDRTRGYEFERPLERLTPEVCYPEAEGWPESYYANPWPLSEDHYLVAWSDRRLPAHRLMAADDPANPPHACGIYLYDRFGNLTLLHRDAAISSGSPIPLRPRPEPPALPDTVDWAGGQEGVFLLQDIYRGLDGLPRGAVRQLRIVAVPPKVQPEMNQPGLGVSREETGKFVLGTVPVEADGSAHFRVPAGVPVFFQAIDQDGLALQTMRSLAYVQPGQTLSCVGCHESRDIAPPAAAIPLAATRAPSLLDPPPDGAWPLRYDRLVQPVLDRQCVSCHRPGAEDTRGAALDLTAAASYGNLLQYADQDLHQLACERDRSIPGDLPARQSKLFALLKAPGGHAGVSLSEEDLGRLALWMDTYAQTAGSFSEQQEHELQAFRERCAHLLTPGAWSEK